MKIVLPCAKGCGGNIEVGDEEIEIANKEGVPLTAVHEVCPSTERFKQSQYRVVVEVYRTREVREDEEWDRLTGMQADDSTEMWVDARDDNTPHRMVREKLTSVGDNTEADDFASAIEPLGIALNKQWEKVINMASVIDS